VDADQHWKGDYDADAAAVYDGDEEMVPSTVAPSSQSPEDQTMMDALDPGAV